MSVFSLGGTWMDKIQNELIRSTVQVELLGYQVRKTKLRWFGHV